MADTQQLQDKAIPAVALWRRLDDAGHDAARLEPQGSGWLLRGVAVFKHRGEPACIGYALELDAAWAMRTAPVQGFVGRREISHAITRTAGHWLHNGTRAAGGRCARRPRLRRSTSPMPWPRSGC